MQPVLYVCVFSPLSSRVGFYVSTFQSLAGFEEKFHKEMGRVRISSIHLQQSLDKELRQSIR